MRTFQLDENLNCRKFRKDCLDGGKCDLFRYPKSLMGTKDYAMLPILLRKSPAIVTTDFRIVEENRDSIVFPNCGILIFRPSSTGVLTSGTLTITKARKLIEKFKSAFPTWNSQSWANVHVDIFEDYVRISLLCANPGVSEKYFGFGDVDFYKQAVVFIQEIQATLAPQLTAANTQPTPG